MIPPKIVWPQYGQILLWLFFDMTKYMTIVVLPLVFLSWYTWPSKIHVWQYEMYMTIIWLHYAHMATLFHCMATIDLDKFIGSNGRSNNPPNKNTTWTIWKHNHQRPPQRSALQSYWIGAICPCMDQSRRAVMGTQSSHTIFCLRLPKNYQRNGSSERLAIGVILTKHREINRVTSPRLHI